MGTSENEGMGRVAGYGEPSKPVEQPSLGVVSGYENPAAPAQSLPHYNVNEASGQHSNHSQALLAFVNVLSKFREGVPSAQQAEELVQVVNEIALRLANSNQPGDLLFLQQQVERVTAKHKRP
ncbi:hypothetical protein E5K00_08340 [Hymenobacter aquaticus]|uniref:Uncharacterized protein n=1 Tax=Hymenobacter aquaticus TaxID=1867101 RepID=A0A4Z0Q7Z7_9BACT|nr:hypothetical protein [Hymenobacter aquaticus]TGE25191.1 hypothetical protein E5K00_08340 [Hymenobacter aquaticus]